MKVFKKKAKPLARSTVTIIVVVLAGVIFASGIAVGRSGLHYRNQKAESVNKTLPAHLDYSSVDQVYAQLKQNFDGKLDQTKLLDGIKEGLVKAAGDPYTEYFDTAGAKDFQDQLDGSFSGIGAELGSQNNAIVIVSPIAGFPAEKAGLKPQDIIAEIDGKSTADMTVSEAVSKIRGEKGTTVKLTVIRGNQPVKVEVTRDTITLPSVKSSMLDGNICYIQISRFGDDTVDLATKAAQDCKDKNGTGVVLDMRGNPGGLLDAAVGLSSLWLPEGKTILQEKRDGQVQRTYTATGNSILKGMKTVALINEGSASASEITAGALKDNGAAELVGQKSFGKGSVQSLLNLGSSLLGKDTKEGLLKVTIARWYTPAGKNIDKAGIEPDVKVAITDDDTKAGRDPQKDKALELVKQ